MIVQCNWNDFQDILLINPPFRNLLFTAVDQVVLKAITINDALPRASILFEISSGPTPNQFKNKFPDSIKVDGILS